MSSSPIQPKKINFTGKCVAATAGESSYLSDALELTLVDGIVTHIRVLTRGSDLPSSSVGLCQRALWEHLRAAGNSFDVSKWRAKE